MHINLLVDKTKSHKVKLHKSSHVQTTTENQQTWHHLKYKRNDGSIEIAQMKSPPKAWPLVNQSTD